MTDAPNKTQIEPMPTGGAVMAIVPQTFPEIQRIAVTIINAGVAPASLVKYAKAEDSAEDVAAIGKRNVAAVSTCIMAGAELGLPPMVSLRAFTVINGKPALYADGNVAVVRKAKTPDGKRVAEYIKTGYEEVRDYICPVCKATFAIAKQATSHLVLTHKEECKELLAVGVNIGDDEIFPRTEPTDKSYAWCEGKRADSGEIYIERFTIGDAKRAGLWEGDKPFKRAKVWRNNVQGWHDDVPNDAPWFRYWKRMMMWRAVGYCLRWLFADVLGGMADEYEAREIEGMVDITPSEPPRREPQGKIEFPDIPELVAEPNDASEPGEKINTPAQTPAEDVNDDDSGVRESNERRRGESLNEFLERLAVELTTASDAATVSEIYDSFDVEGGLGDDTMGIADAEEMRDKRLAQIKLAGVARTI